MILNDQFEDKSSIAEIIIFRLDVDLQIKLLGNSCGVNPNGYFLYAYKNDPPIPKEFYKLCKKYAKGIKKEIHAVGKGEDKQDCYFVIYSFSDGSWFETREYVGHVKKKKSKRKFR